jgi:small-conductance mechanosensitive channel
MSAEVRFWADSRRSDFVATRARVRAGIIEALRREGIELPDPEARRIRVELGNRSPAPRG